MPILDDLKSEVEGFFAHLREHPIASDVLPGEIRRHLANRYDFEKPVPLEHVFQDVRQMFHRWNEHSTHPRHFGLFNPSVDLSGVVADALVALYNPQIGTWDLSPAGNEIERHTLRPLSAAFGFDPDSAAAHFTSGGSEANHTAVIVALTHRFQCFRQQGLRGLRALPVFYLSQEGHHSFEKIAQMCGLGREALRFIATRPDLAMDVDALARQMDDDLDRGFVPFLVIGTAGTTSAGVIDPLDAIARLCRRRGVWFHVDAAWGGAAVLSARLRPALSGIENADSITCDAHKWLSVPLGAGMFFCRHRAAVATSFEVETPYVPTRARNCADYPFLASIQWSRRLIGLKLFMMLAELGISGVAARIERQAELGEELRHRLLDSGWRLLNRTPLPLVCFTHPRLEKGGLPAHEALVHTVTREQAGWISHTVLGREQPALRAAVTSFHTTEDDVDALVSGLNNSVRRRSAAVCSA